MVVAAVPWYGACKHRFQAAGSGCYLHLVSQVCAHPESLLVNCC